MKEQFGGAWQGGPTPDEGLPSRQWRESAVSAGPYRGSRHRGAKGVNPSALRIRVEQRRTTMTSATSQYTDFSKDVLGRYICNGLDEAIASTTGPGGRPFDIIIIGGGSFGSALAQHALYRDRFHNHRILVLDAGPHVLSEHVQNLPALGLSSPPPVESDPGKARAEVWGLPWRSNV